jgi:hypothetical protein
MSYFEQTNIVDAEKKIVNPASEESIVLLRRIAKILENQQAVDPQQRQRVTIDAITGALTLSTVTIVGTVGTVSTVTSVSNIAALNGWNQQMFADPARSAYNTGIRQQLTFA